MAVRREIQRLLPHLPPMFGRSEVERLFPGVITAKTLAKLDSLGQGPPRFKRGKKVFYLTEDFLAWLLKANEN